MNLPPQHPTRRLDGIETVPAGASTYRRMLTAAPATGRCPVWMSDPDALRNDRRREPDPADLDTRDAHEVLTRRWPGPCPCPQDCPDCLEPFTDGFPGLLARPAVEREDAVDAAVAAADGPWAAGELALVPVSRPADVPAAIEWLGMGNSWDDPVGLSAVLRSWEERFGAMLVRIHHSTLELGVASPPRSEEECLCVAAEHLAFCWDAFETYTGQMSTDTLRQYAARLRGAPRWRFWWD